MSDPLSNRLEGMESPSAYASAESSPSQSMATSLSMHSMQNGQQQFEDSPTRSGTMPVSQSMNCFGSKSPSSSHSSTHHINLASIPSSMSVSDIDTLAKLEELNMQAFTSLPPVTNSPKSGETVKAVIERTVKAELEKQTSPKISPSRSSVFSMLGRIFKSASKSGGEEKPKGNVSPTSSTASSSSPNPECSPFKLLERPQMNEDLEQLRKREDVLSKDEKTSGECRVETLGSTIEKLVQLNEEKSSANIDHDPILSPKSVAAVDQVQVHVQSNSADTRVELLQSSENMKVPASSQEFCMDLNLNIAASAALAAAAPVTICEQQQQSTTQGKTSCKVTSNLHGSSSNTNDDHQRFTKNASTSSIHNDLKAILEESKESFNGGESAGASGKKSATSVAAPTAAAEGLSPASVNSSSSSSKKKNSSSSKKKSSSTSSSAAVAAAAEASDDANKTTSTTAGGETSVTQPVSPPKPQRERKHRSKQSKSSTSEKKSSSSTSTKSPEVNQLSVLEMLMKTAMEAAVATTTTTTAVTSATTKSTTCNSSSSSSSNKETTSRNAHRYSREFLLRIRDERSKLIDNICPDIFRTHAYCISGMFWDPEKYFNAILHGERLHDFVNNNHADAATMHPSAAGSTNANKTTLSTSSASSVPYTKSFVQRSKHTTGQSPRQYYNKQMLMSPRSNYTNTSGRQQWVKNNKLQMNRSRNGNDLLDSLMSGNAKSKLDGNSLSDKYLLDLLKRGNSAPSSTNTITTSPKQNSGIDLMSMLNKKHVSNLFNNETSAAPVKSTSQPRHTPLILTAQELEFSQLFSASVVNTTKKQSLSPSSCSQRTSGSSPSLSSSLSPTSSSSGGVVKSITEGDLSLIDINSSDAYKQLVKNLSNHPLSASSASVAAKTTVDDLFNSVMAQKTEENQQKEGTNLLKQLLHLNLSQSEEKPVRVSKNNSYYNNRYQRQMKTSGKSSAYARRSLNSSLNNETNLEDLILNKLKHNSPESQNNKSEQEHFKTLLDKLVPSLSTHLVASSSVSGSSNKPSDIMKWFRTSTTAQNTTL